ncbi:hypothetical protein HJFPF1_05740 [Paramyrothecium foliicola]|nr:hypothetical protein HJFPF1_05740 [Paramyrothecium foliicola]
MKFNTILLAVLPTVLALPTGDDVAGLSSRQSNNAVTDQLLFSLSLPGFTSRRNARNPPGLDWSSDNCSWSPDNPLGYPFEPACHRHDFGYRNYKNQNRFTDANKLRIDNNFRTDLYYQCDVSGSGSLCRGLANVYYNAVRAFGRSAATSEALRTADNELVRVYEESVAEWEAALKEAQEKGEVPAF